MNHFDSKYKVLAVLGVLAIIAGVGMGYRAYFGMQGYSADQNGEELPPPQSPADSMVSDGAEVPVEIGNQSLDFPVLHRPVTFSSAFSVEAQDIMRKKIDASIVALEKDPKVFDEWMNLAILRKTVDDYEGAREIWEFLKIMNPRHQGPSANLAALYAFDLKDPVRAEQNFTIALELWKKDTMVWRNAYDFYRYVRKDDQKAKEMLANGIKETESPDLQYLLDHYSEL
ncbi:MAG: hypothetical protein AAB916_02300 [Patescibacteria group bacterium]